MKSLEFIQQIHEMAQMKGWEYVRGDIQDTIAQRIESLIASGDTDDEKLKGEINGLRKAIDIVDEYVREWKDHIRKKG